MGANQNPAKTLIETVWGSNFFDSLPAKWKSTLKMKRYKTPGVPNGSLPDAITEIDVDNLLEEIVATSQVTTNRTNELEKITEKIQVALLLTTTTSGQDYDAEFDLVIPYTEHLALNGVEVGDARKEIHPLNPILSEVKILDFSAFDAVLSTYKLDFPSTTNIDIPDFLTGITIALETDQSTGTAQVETAVISLSGDHSLTLPASATAQGSASVAAEVIPHMVPFYGVKRKVTNYLFFLPSPVTSADIVARLETITSQTVVDWSDFKPTYVTISILSKRQSARVTASVTVHDSSSSGGSAQVLTIGPETSKEGGLHIKTVRLPATLHGDITLTDIFGSPIALTGSFTAAVDAYAFCAGGSIGTYTLHPSANATASYAIITDGLEATEGATSLPSSGLLIVNTSSRPYKYGYVMINAEVLNASTL